MYIFSKPLSYYFSLITSEYQNSPNFLTWLKAALGQLDDTTVCLASFFAAFDLDTAVGAQLDILGDIVGANRTVNFVPSNGVSPVLDDTSYRTYIKATIGANFWDGTIDGLQALWTNLFPLGNILIMDAQDMSFTAMLGGTFTSIMSDLILNGYIVPRPEGVRVNYVFSLKPIFGFDLNDANIAGFDKGHWS